MTASSSSLPTLIQEELETDVTRLGTWHLSELYQLCRISNDQAIPNLGIHNVR